MTEEETRQLQEELAKNQNNNKLAQQKQTERRRASDIIRDINTLEEKLVSIRKQYSDYHAVLLKKNMSDERTKDEFAQQMKQLHKQIAALKNIQTARKFLSPEETTTWLGMSSTPKYVITPNQNDEYRTDLDGGSLRIIHRDDAGKIAAISMKDISRDPVNSIKQISAHQEDWDDYLKAHDKAKTLHIKSPSPAMNHYLYVYSMARHGQPAEIHAVNDGLSKTLLEQDEHAIYGAGMCYRKLYQELMDAPGLSDQDKSTLKDEINAELGLGDKEFTKYIDETLNNEQKHNTLFKPSTGTSVKRVFGQDEEYKQLVNDQSEQKQRLESKQLANIFSKYYQKLDNGVSATINTEIRQSSTATLRAS